MEHEEGSNLAEVKEWISGERNGCLVRYCVLVDKGTIEWGDCASRGVIVLQVWRAKGRVSGGRDLDLAFVEGRRS